ncbi:MAG: hypothetical protein JWP44_4218 [Mucilaginibacter sp.]|nr:hypothetical protein [Mucilaginibacter sp.]
MALMKAMTVVMAIPYTTTDISYSPLTYETRISSPFRMRNFQFDQLPRCPWPLTVGGLPITLSDKDGNGRCLMYPRQKFGNFHIGICSDTTMDVFTDNTLCELEAEVDSEFRRNLAEIRVIEIIYTGERTFYIVIPDHVNIFGMTTKLPGMVAGCVVGYLNETELQRPGGADFEAGLVTGQLQKSSGADSHPERLATSDDEKRSCTCYWSSSHAGFIEGSVVGHSVRMERMPPERTCSEVGETVQYVAHNWVYLGQQEGNEDAQRSEGTSGTAVWDDNGTIIGFYCYCMLDGPWAGFAVSVSASELNAKGRFDSRLVLV